MPLSAFPPSARIHSIINGLLIKRYELQLMIRAGRLSPAAAAAAQHHHPAATLLPTFSPSPSLPIKLVSKARWSFGGRFLWHFFSAFYFFLSILFLILP